MCIEKDFLNISQGNNCYIDADAISTDGLFRRHHSSTAALCDVFINLHQHRRTETAGGYMYVPGESREMYLLVVKALIHVLVRYWCFRCIARYATKYQVTYENRRLPTVPTCTTPRQAGRFVGTRGVQTT